MGRVDQRPFPPGEYDVVVVGSGPGGLQTAYSLARAGVTRCAVLSRDPAPGGMFRRWPVYQRLISWTKPDAPFEPGTREYEWYDHNSLVGDEPEHQALVRGFMDRAYDVPARGEMEAGLVAFAERNVEVRYECEWLTTSRDENGFVIGTSDGEYRCTVCVFAIGVTEPWTAPIPGLDAAPHYADTRTQEHYRGKSVFIVGKRNSAFELAQGLLPWASRIVLASPRPVQTAVLAFSPLSIRYLSPYMQHIRGGSGSFVVDAAIERVERHADGYRIRASGTTWDGEIELDADEVIAATGFRAPVRDLPSIGVAMVNDGRMPAQTPYWESVSRAGDLLRRQRDGCLGRPPQARRHVECRLRERLPLQRARPRPPHRGEAFRARARTTRARRATQVVPFLLGELARAPELLIQKGYLARVVETDGGYRDGGIVPLADYVDRAGADSVAVTTEYAADGAVTPVVYVRRNGRLAEHALPTDPLHRFDTDDHRKQLDALV